jgi:hypothetical protein
VNVKADRMKGSERMNVLLLLACGLLISLTYALGKLATQAGV